jgi:hypothetical protein
MTGLPPWKGDYHNNLNTQLEDKQDGAIPPRSHTPVSTHPLSTVPLPRAAEFVFNLVMNYRFLGELPLPWLCLMAMVALCAESDEAVSKSVPVIRAIVPPDRGFYAKRPDYTVRMEPPAARPATDDPAMRPADYQPSGGLLRLAQYPLA